MLRCFPRFLLSPSKRLFSSEIPSAAAATKILKAVPIVIEAGKRNLKQSPLKIKFLVSLIQDKWVPDAVAQLKFSPKHRAVDVAKILNRGIALAKLSHNYIAEELIVKEVLVTKGIAIKRMRIMGRGRTGVGYTRSAHVLVKLAPVDFPALIKSSRDVHDRGLWRKRQASAEKKKLENSQQINASTVSTASSSS